MTALFPLLIPALLGYFTLVTLLGSAPLRHKNLFLIAAILPTGFGLCSAILFISLWIMPLHAKLISFSISVAAILALGSFLFFKRSGTVRPPAIFHPFLDIKSSFLQTLSDKKAAVKLGVRLLSMLVFFATLWTIIRFFTLSVSSNITGGWDARYMWSLKAKFLFYATSDWQALFSPQILWTHPDYPLLWPGTLAWGWNCLGRESLLWPPWASLYFYIACALILVWYLATHISRVTGWIAGTFFLVLTPPLFWSIHQYADVPLTFFITASGLMLITALRSGEARFFIISGLMAGLAAWTKNEGLLFLLWTGILLGSLLCFKRFIPSKKPFSLKPFLAGAFFPALWILAFKIFLGQHGDYFGSSRSAHDYLVLALDGWKNSTVILQAFWNQLSSFAAWKSLWAFFFLACMVLFFKKRKKGDEEVLLALIFLINLGYILAFLTTPNDLKWHLQTALERLLIHTAPLALAFTFEVLTFRANDGRK